MQMAAIAGPKIGMATLQRPCILQQLQFVAGQIHIGDANRRLRHAGDLSHDRIVIQRWFADWHPEHVTKEAYRPFQVRGGDTRMRYAEHFATVHDEPSKSTVHTGAPTATSVPAGAKISTSVPGA